MKVLVVYDTSYGNTEKIALSICAGMKEVGLNDVTCKKADSVVIDDFKSADVWVLGSPTHVGSATGTIKKVLKSAIKTGASAKIGVAFDTRFDKATKGGAQKIQKMMERAGMKIAVPGEWFIVENMKGPLAPGEEAKAVTFGRKIAGAIRQK
jgi:flavorubredoxin